MKSLNALFALILTVSFATSVVADEDKKNSAIAERIKPVGSVCVQGDDCGGPAVAASAGEPRSGEEIYGQFCTACHAVGVLGAPKKGDKAAWDTRLAKGFDQSVALAIKGINAMPPRGTCADCSDEEIAAAVEFMVE